MSKEHADFQTPPELVTAVLECLRVDGNLYPRVFEPTCGQGNFISGLLNLSVPPREIQAVEIQDVHYTRAKQIANQCLSTRIKVQKANLFDLDLIQDLKWHEPGRLLVVGNPPWITNSQLSVLESNNVLVKINLKGLKGLDALTGSSNFDIAEYIWLKLIRELASEKPTIALLCKPSVARNVLQFAFKESLLISNASIRMFDGGKWFNTLVGSCLFTLEVGAENACYEAAVYKNLNTTNPESVIGVVKGKLVADVASYKHSDFIDGVSPVTWRQGIKHDAASVMELTYSLKGVLQNKLGEIVAVEHNYVYPLLKCSDLFNGVTGSLKRAVIVTQKQLNESTQHLEELAPQLWRYLNSHIDKFERRKSSIYRGKSLFSMFGVGDYSFALYKVGISGLHKIPKFRVITPVNGRPVMLDDTCYFVPCYSLEQATLLCSLLNNPVCLDFIRSRIFLDAKRPITKKLLQILDLKAILDRLESKELLLQASAEFEQLKTALNQNKPSWPSSLGELLVECLPRSD